MSTQLSAAESEASSAREATYERVEQALSLPMLVLSLSLVPVLVIPLAWSHMPASVNDGFQVADYGIWAAFALEYVLLLSLAPNRRKFMRGHVLELALVLLPMLRPLRIMRSARALRVVRVGRAAAGVGAAVSISRRQMAVSAALYAPVAALVVVVAGAVFVLNLERGAKGANITDLPTALWWAATTITTVGYGDHYPVTAAGRVVAVALMIIGIGLLGVVSASIAASFVRWAAEPDELEGHVEHARQQVELVDVLDELRQVRAELASLRAAQTQLES
jgi:voltage-gated potassium channel